MSRAFEQAWDVVKMARHAIGPTEIWDAKEQLGGEDKMAEFVQERNLPIHYSRGYMKDPTIHYPLGGSPYFGNQQVKAMMTPQEYLGLVLEGARESRYEHTLEGQRKLMEQGAPIFIPALSITNSNRYGHDADYSVIGHEGRHRMQTLADMGFGDTKVPVLIASDDYFGDPYRMYGGNERYQDKMMGAVLEPQGDWEGEGGSRSRQFTIDEINPLWRRGEVEQL